MNEFATVRYAEEDNVAIVTICRPEAMNAFNSQLRADLLAVLKKAKENNNIRVVILTGEGRSFSAGADLKSSLGKEEDVEKMLQAEYRPILECIWDMDKPVIAAVAGSAAGIGVSLALVCDLLVMEEDAFLLSPFTTISLVPDGGLNWLLVQQIGYRRAFQLSIESERISAEQALELGLSNKVVSQGNLMVETIRWAKSISNRAPLSVAATKKMMRHATSGSWESTFDLEAPLQADLRKSDDCVEGVKAFLTKRDPDFKGK